MKTNLVSIPNNYMESVTQFLEERKVKALIWEEVKQAMSTLQGRVYTTSTCHIRQALSKIPGAKVSVSRVPHGFEVTLYGPYNTGYAEALTFTAPPVGTPTPYIEALESLNERLLKSLNSAPQMLVELPSLQEKVNSYKAALAAAEAAFAELGDFGYLVQMASMIATEEDFCN